MNAELSVHRGVRWGNRWNEDPWVISGRTGVSRSGADIGRGRSNATEGYGKSIENELKRGECEWVAPSHGASGCMLMEGEREGETSSRLCRHAGTSYACGLLVAVEEDRLERTQEW